MTMPDAALAAALKQANVRKLSFAFIAKGPDGKLIVSQGKISPQQLTEALKAAGGGIVVRGKCFGPFPRLVFQVAKEPPATLAPALQRVVKSETGVSIVAEIQLAADADE
jgi:hypothetical protein